MGLFKTIRQLHRNQLDAVATTLSVDSNDNKEKQVRRSVVNSLNAFYQDAKGYETIEGADIVRHWRELVSKIIESRNVSSENERRKQQVLQDLSALDGPTLNCDDQIESVVRDILLLLWEESTDADKKKFRDVVRKELDTHNVKLTEQEIDKAMRNLLIGRAGSALPFLLPVVSGILLRNMTKGFVGWAAITVLGKGALKASVLGAVAGPIGWAFTVGALGISITTSGLKYRKERRKLGFIQAILSIYSYSYQNRFSKRRGASAA